MVTYANDLRRICIWVVEHVFRHVFYRPYLKTEVMGRQWPKSWYRGDRLTESELLERQN